MAFRKHWVNFLHGAATGTRKTRTLLTPLGLTIFTAFTALFVFAAIIADRLLSLGDLLPAAVRLPVSIPLTVAGLAVTAWSAFHFLKVKGTSLLPGPIHWLRIWFLPI